MNAPLPGEISILLMAVVQAQDAESADTALTRLGVSVTRLPSVGGFLGRRNATLLIALPAARKNLVVETLNKNCRQRVEYLAIPLEGSPLPMPTPVPVTVGGATIFTLPVDRFEEF